MQVCVATNHLLWNTRMGGHAWVFLNWALGLKAAGAQVVLLEKMRFADDHETLLTRLSAFHERIGALGLDVEVTLLETSEQSERLAEIRTDLAALTVPLEHVFATADLFLNFRYGIKQDVVDRFARSALVDIDPGLLQGWITAGTVAPARHDMQFSIGETVGQPGAAFPDCGLTWHHTRPPVHLPSWPMCEAPAGAPFTTVTNWWGEYEMLNGESINNEKRTHFVDNIDLPSQTRTAIELAIYHEDGNHTEMPLLREHGWRARPAGEVSGTAQQYRDYVQASRGEFSFAKQSCMTLQNAWISDRTICYLASGKPAVVQHTGPSRFLPDTGSLWRFESASQAAEHLDYLEDERHYAESCAAARALAEAHFDAERVARDLLATAMTHEVRRQRVH